MNKFFFIVLFTLLPISGFSQAWVNSGVVNATVIEPKYSCIDDQNNLIIIGVFSGAITSPFSETSYGSNDLILLKYNPSGTILWHKHIGSPAMESCGGVAVDESNNIYVLGNYQGPCKFDNNFTLNNSGGMDVFMAKYGNDGTFEWANRICGASNNQGSTDLKYDFHNSNTLVVSGYFKDSLIIGSLPSEYDTLTGTPPTSSFIATFTLTGALQKVTRYLQNYDLARINKIAVSSGGYFFSGNFRQNFYFDIDTITSLTPGSNDAFIYKTDFNFNGEWIRRIRGTLSDNFRSIITDKFDNVYVLGNYTSPAILIDSTENNVITRSGSLGSVDKYIGKYNRSGILQWLVQKGGTGSDYYNDFVINNNVIYATGYFADMLILNDDTLRTSSQSNQDPFLAAFNEIGDPIAGVSIAGTGDVGDAGVIVNTDVSSRAYISGYFRSPEIMIGSQTYLNSNPNNSNLFFSIYAHPFSAVITRQDNVTCNGLSDGLLQVTPYFGRPPFTYTWSHDANLHTNTADNLPAGLYLVSIEDANNEEDSVTVIVSEPESIEANALITPATCYNFNTGAIDITVTGGTKTADYVYNWTTLDGSGVSPLNQDQTGLTNGTYSVTIEDDNHCTLSTDFLVSEPSALHFTGSTVSNLTFPPGNNGAIDLHITGGNSPYATQWTGPSGFTSSLEDLSGLTAGGLYSVALTDSKNCIADTSLAVNDGTTLIAQFTAKTPVLCFGDDNGSAEITVTNGVAPFSFQWSDGLVTGLNTRTNMAVGTYQVLVSDAALPVPHTAQAEVEITGPSSPLALLVDPQNLRCYQDASGIIDLSVSGGTLPYRFVWNTGYTGEDLVNIPVGSYAVTVTDTNNCIGQGNTVITQPDAMSLDIILDTRVLCYGENTASATANVNGGSGNYSYFWNDPGAQITRTAVQLTAGNFTAIVTDQNDCSISESVLITQPASLSVSAVTTEPSCSGEEDAAIVPVVSGGTAPYDYVWSNNVFQRINSDIPAGNYSLTVTDINSCSRVTDYVITDPPPVVINQLDSTDASCFGVADGSIHIDAVGGTGSLSYSADNGLNFTASPDIGSLPAALYTVVVRDSRDCASATRTIAVDQPAEITFDTVLITVASCYGYTDGAVEIFALGGTGVFEYSSDNGASFVPSPTIASLMNGTYQLVIKDDDNCLSAIRLANVGPDEEFSVDTIEVVRGSINNPLGSITLENTGGASPVDFVIVPDSSSNTTGVFNDLVAQTYRVFAMDASLCKSNELLVSMIVPETGLVVYDAFSPNEDGINDVWNIPGIGNYPNCSVKIFNTWGVAIFTSKGYGIPWDGKYKGNDLPSGTYYYVIDPGDGSGELSGPVSLVK